MTAAEGVSSATSERKQRIYSEYVRGQLSLAQLMEKVRDVLPPARLMSKRRRIAAVAVGAVIAFLVPSQHRKE